MFRRPLVVRTPGYITVVCVVALSLSGVALGAALDAPSPAWSSAGIGWVIGPPVWALLFLRQSVLVTEEQVLVRNLLRTHRLSTDSVTTVAAVYYDGLWIPGGSLVLTSIRFDTADRTVTAYCLVTTPVRAERLADRLRSALDLAPVRRTPGGRHRLS